MRTYQSKGATQFLEGKLDVVLSVVPLEVFNVLFVRFYTETDKVIYWLIAKAYLRRLVHLWRQVLRRHCQSRLSHTSCRRRLSCGRAWQPTHSTTSANRESQSWIESCQPIHTTHWERCIFYKLGGLSYVDWVHFRGLLSSEALGSFNLVDGLGLGHVLNLLGGFSSTGLLLSCCNDIKHHIYLTNYKTLW